MIYLDNGATSLHKPPQVHRAVQWAMKNCANPGRGGHDTAMAAAKVVFGCRDRSAQMFGCNPEQVVFTSNCTHGLNIAIQSLVKPGASVVISGFEHNAVVRPLYALGAKITVAGRRLFDPADTLERFEAALRSGANAAVFTHVSNVFGYILPVQEMAVLCRRYGVPFIIDAAQSAGMLEVNLKALGANFIAMPGHKGLLGPQGTGLLLCADSALPLLYGGTGSESMRRDMPDDLPERLEAGTLNVPGIAGLGAGLEWIRRCGMDRIRSTAHNELLFCAAEMRKMGLQVFAGKHMLATVSFVPDGDCEACAQALARLGIAVRAGLHCAPLAHESAGTLETGTVRVSFGHDACRSQSQHLLRTMRTAGGG